MSAAVPVLLLLLTGTYPWLSEDDPRNALAARVPPPQGYEREGVTAGGFADWLRHLPLKPGRPAVRLFNGQPKHNQSAHVAVVDIDVGDRDLQQCADAIIRLRAEYLYAVGRADAIAFDFTSGDRAEFSRWATGERPVVNGSAVGWRRSARPDSSYSSLRRFLDTVFMYAGSHSLEKELAPLATEELAGGNVFIQGGFPGHAVIVVDTARHPRTGRRVFLLAQSYMPAQEIHILRNPAGENPWYDLDFGPLLITPEWTFERQALCRFQ
jgi:hypothetical protein